MKPHPVRVVPTTCKVENCDIDILTDYFPTYSLNEVFMDN